MKNLLIPIVALLLGSGCAHSVWYASKPDEAYTWYRYGPPLPAEFVLTTKAKVQEVCPQTKGALACAYYEPAAGKCTVYHFFKMTPSNPIYQHELKHCQGWQHREN